MILQNIFLSDGMLRILRPPKLFRCHRHKQWNAVVLFFGKEFHGNFLICLIFHPTIPFLYHEIKLVFLHDTKVNMAGNSSQTFGTTLLEKTQRKYIN